MADRVDADVDAMRAPSAGRPLDDVPAQPKRLELPKRNDPVLFDGKRGDRVIARRRAWMRFGAHSAPEVIHPSHDAELEVEIRAGGAVKVTKA